MIGRTILLVLLLTLVVANANAGVKAGDAVLILNVGYASGKAKATGNNVEGGIFGLDYQKRDWDKPVSGGFSMGYGQLNETVKRDSSQTDYTISTIPIYLGGKYWLGDGEKRIQGYVGAAFGIYFAQLETSVQWTLGPKSKTGSGSYTSETALGFGLGIPVGIAFSLGDTILLTANYTLNWLFDSEILDNDILNAGSLGIAYRFGH
jgi:hypothetical protein